MPLVPLWGVWADKYSRKVVIVRSALVEAVVFAGVALSREPWQLAVSMLLIGFQLGNTGVMLAGIRDVTPLRRLGVTIAVFGASGPIGFAVGPALAGVLIDGFSWSLSGVFWLSSLFSIGTALLVTFGSREVRPAVVPTGGLVELAFGAVKGVLADPAVRRVFLIFGVAFLGTQMSRPYIPVLVEGIVGPGPGLASAIGLVAGTSALVGALDLAARWAHRGPDRLPDRAHRGAGRRRRRPAAHADRAVALVDGPARGRPRGLHGHGERHGLRGACARGPARTPLGDAEPRVPAALRRGHPRAGARCGRVVGPAASTPCSSSRASSSSPVRSGSR